MSMRSTAARVILVAATCCTATACSTLTRGSHQTLSFKADSPNATLYVDRKTVTLPAKVELSRKRSHTILVTAPGREPVQFTLDPHFDGLSLGNLIYPGGSLGMLTDFLTGADKAFTSVGTIKLPHADPATASEPTLVLLHQHKSQLLTREELDSLKGGESAETAATHAAPGADDEPAERPVGG